MRGNWIKLQHELDCWADQGLTARFWARDDDAHELTEPLVRLHALARDHKITVGLAVVPGLLDSELLNFLGAAKRQFFPMCHGWKHINHAPANRPSEFGNDRPFYRLLNDLQLAYNRFRRCFGHSNVIFVPPYAGIAPSLIKALPSVGFSGLSIGPGFVEFHLAQLAEKVWIPGIKLPRRSTVPQINAQIDLIDWHLATARDAGSVAESLVGYLRLRRRGILNSDSPLGLLTHHLRHDEKVWTLYEDLLEFLCHHHAVQFFDLSDEVEAMSVSAAFGQTASMHPQHEPI